VCAPDLSDHPVTERAERPSLGRHRRRWEKEREKEHREEENDEEENDEKAAGTNTARLDHPLAIRPGFWSAQG
jgi:hypothetical protein